MKKNLGITVVFTALCLIGCKSSPQFESVQKGPVEVQFADLIGKEWQLIDVHINNKDIFFDRASLVSEGFGEIFTLNFEAENLNGIGAPNRYFGPYTSGDNQSISVNVLGSTMMAALREPEKLKEHDYFIYIQNVYQWNFVNDTLELFSKSEDGIEVKLFFILGK